MTTVAFWFEIYEGHFVCYPLIASRFVPEGDAQSAGDRSRRQNGASLMVSMLREEGVLVPFAQYRNETWSGPKSLADSASPWFERGGSLSTRWYFWPSPDSPTVLKATKAVRVESHCQTIWALQSNLPKPPVGVGHDDNIGVALNVNQKVENLIKLESETSESVDVSLLVNFAFEKTERTRIPKPNPSRVGTPATLQKLYRSRARVKGQHIYYFEAAKQYGSADPTCNDVSFFKGWILKQSNGSPVLVSSHLAFTDCDMKTERSTLPFGVIVINDRTFLIAQEHGYEDESYVVFEIRGSRIRRLLEVSGGGC